ncbi:MAG: hypothetical protein SGILL_010375, partial [Bacillariaceae sp.]
MAINNPCLKDIFCHEDISRVLIPFLSEKDHENVRIVSREFHGSIDGFAKKKVLALHDMIPSKYKEEFCDNLSAKIMKRAKKLVNLICSNIPPISNYLRWKMMLGTCVHQLTENELALQRAPIGSIISVYEMGTSHFVFSNGRDYRIWSLQQGRSLGLFQLALGRRDIFQRASVLDDGRLLVVGEHVLNFRDQQYLRIYRQVQVNSVLKWEIEVERSTDFRALGTVHAKWIDKGGRHHDQLVYVGTGDCLNWSDGLQIGTVNTSDGRLSEYHRIDFTLPDGTVVIRRYELLASTNYFKVELCNKTWLAINSTKYGLVLYNLANGACQIALPRNKNNCILSCKGKPDTNAFYTMETASTSRPLECASLHCFKLNDDGTLEHQFSIPDIPSATGDFCVGTHHDTIA